MRVLVTGITGFVGGHLSEQLLESGDVVAGLSSTGRWPEPLLHLAERVRLEKCDLAATEPEDLAGLIARKQPEAIYHLAAQPNPQASVADPRGTWRINLGGALNLLEAIRLSGQRPKVVLVGSGVSYGNPDPRHLPVDESCPLRPNNAYAASKAAADLLGIQHVLAHQAQIVIARPFNHAGPRQNSSYVLSALSRQVAEVELALKEQVEVGNLEVVRDFADVRDVVTAYRLLVADGLSGEIYNVGSGQGTRLQDALDSLLTLARAPITVHVDPARLRPVDLPLLVCNPSKLQQTTGWRPRYTIAQTLADMLDYWRQALAPR